MSPAQAQESPKEKEKTVKLTALAAQAADAAQRYQNALNRKRNQDRALINALISLDGTVNHPEDAHVPLQPLKTLVAQLPNLVSNAVEGQQSDEAKNMLAEIETIVSAVEAIV
jgi:seryl-tRNA synthetase